MVDSRDGNHSVFCRRFYGFSPNETMTRGGTLCTGREGRGEVPWRGCHRDASHASRIHALDVPPARLLSGSAKGSGVDFATNTSFYMASSLSSRNRLPTP